MVNLSKKGWKKERECRKLLQKQGWQVVFKSIRWKYGTLDFAGLFDTVAVRKAISQAEPKLEWLFVSNKHDTSYRKAHLTQIQAFKEAFGIEEGLWQVWIWIKPKWTGRGSKKQWQQAKWQIIEV